MKPRLLHLRLACLSFTLIIVAALAAHAQTISFTSSPYHSGADKAPATIGVAYIYDSDAEASDGSEVRYSLRFGPSGMSVDPRTGVIGWQPDEEGEFDAEIRAELADNPSVNTTQMWKIAVSKPQGHPGCTGNEVWLPVGKTFPGPGIAATVMNDELYVMHQSTSSWASPAHLSKWNGSYWTTLSAPDMKQDSIRQIIGFRGEIYASTLWHSIPNVPEGTSIIRWDGTSWSGTGTHDFTEVIDMEVVNDELYVLAERWVGQDWKQVVAKWDGTDWETVIEEGMGPRGYWGIALASMNDKLYVACSPGSFGLEWNELPLFVLDNGTLVPVDNRELDHVEDVAYTDLIVHNGTLVLVGHSIFQWDGTKTTRLTAPPASKVSYNLQSAISYNDQLYIGFWDYDRALPAILDYQIWRLADGEWHPVSAIQALFRDQARATDLQLIEYNDDLYGYGIIYQSCDVALNGIAVLGTENECARISGSVYHDDNQSCSIDPSEPALKGELVEILPGPFYAMTNGAGTFSTLLRPGTYTLAVQPKQNWMDPCINPAEVTLASPAASVDVNLGTDMIPGIYDVRSSLMVGRPRPGFDFTYTLTYWNSGTEPATGRMIFEYDNRLAYQSSTTVPSRQNGAVLEWDFANLPVGASISVTVTLSVPQAMPIGTELCARVDVELERKDDDEFLSDNSDFICTTVRGSFDPNDIQVTPRRYDEELGDAPLLPGDTVLSYLVRFQNTGNDTAFTVVVADTLDASLLDITSIRLGAASHDFDFDISGTGILTWTFNNILLPDSGVNELASHGYFKYTVRLRKGLPPLTQIPNHASIYFDYNAPVKTNTVVSVTSGTLSVGEEDAAAASLQIYPNPVRGTSSIRLNLTDRGQVKLRLIDGRGDVIAILADKEMSAGEHTLSLNAKGLSSGAYYLVLERNGIKEIYPVVVGE